MDKKVWNLNFGNELRILIPKSSSAFVQVDNRSCELLGASLSPDKEYSFKGQLSIPIFTWSNCVVTTNQSNSEKSRIVVYKEKKSVFPKILKALTSILKTNKSVIKISVLGVKNSGKNSIVKTICNYSNKLGAHTLILDLDLSSNLFTLPGAVSACLKNSYKIGKTDFSLSNEPLLTSLFGSERLLKRNIKKYLNCVDFIFSNVEKLIESFKYKNKKLIVVSKLNSIAESIDKEAAAKILKRYKSDFIFTIGADAVFAEVKEVLKNSEIGLTENGSSDWNVFSFPILQGIPPLDSVSAHDKRKFKFRNYFFPSKIINLAPRKLEMKFGTFTIYKWPEHSFPSSVLPKGEIRVLEKKPLIVRVNKNLVNSVFGICHHTAANVDFGIYIFGFAILMNINEEKKVANFLLPEDGGLPSRKLILTGMKWIDN